MDKNSVIGIILITIILIVWGVFTKPNKEELANRQRQIDSLEQVKSRKYDSIQKIIKEQELKDLQITDTVEAIDTNKLQRVYGVFANVATGENEFVELENDVLKLTLSSKGGRPYRAELKDYQTHDSLPLVLFDGDSTIFGSELNLGTNYKNSNELYYTIGNVVESYYEGITAKSVSLKLDVSENKYIEHIYTIYENSYMVDVDVKMVGMNENITYPSYVDFRWEIYSPQQEKGRQSENQYSSLYYKPLQEKVEKLKRSKNSAQNASLSTPAEWIAFKDQFFSTILIGDKPFIHAKTLKCKNLPENSKHLKIYSTQVGLPIQKSNNENISLKLYFGPNKYKILKQYKEYELKDLVSVGRGIIKFINQYVIIRIFDWLNSFIGNYGIIILLLTIIIKIFLIPLTYRSYLSQAKMRILKPQVDELAKKYPKKEQAMEKQKATMALYKKAGASSMGGCLPMILQMPILFAMFRFFPTSIELRQESFLWAKDLSTYDAIIEWQGNIPFISATLGNHLSLFTVLMTITTILSMRLNSQATSSSQAMPGMKGMMYIMPIMFFFILNKFSAALTYYYFLANLITLGQNWLFKQFIDEDAMLKKMQARQTKPVKKSKWQQRMEEAARQRGKKLPKRR